MIQNRTRSFRFIYSGTHDGYTNMAMDEAILIGLRENRSLPVLRIYKWDPPTISIGLFQSAADIDYDKCKDDGIGIVRRPTGGRAVLHDEELTYSILFTANDYKPFRKKDIFIFVAGCLVNSLRLLGIECKIAEKSRGDLRTANCFAAPAQFEIETLGHGKLIGSAQVIKDGVALQHGAIPLTGSYKNISKYLKCDSAFKKNISSLSQAAAVKINEEDLLTALKNGFGQHIPLIEGELSDFEMSLTTALVRDKYSHDKWMYNR
jgi:lipoate-protein ligase A